MSNKSNWSLERQGIEKYSIRLLEGCNKIGRTANSDIIMSESTYISRDHCEIIVDISQVQLIDHSTNGTYINEEQIKNQRKILSENDIIGFGVDVSDKQPINVQYHVYILKKSTRIIMCPAVILVDSDSENENISSCSKSTKRTKENNIPSNSVESAKPNNIIKIISNVFLADSDSDGENENIASCSKYTKRSEEKNIPSNSVESVKLNNKTKIISNLLFVDSDSDGENENIASCSKYTKRSEENNIPSNSVESVKPNNKTKIISNILLADSDSDSENENIASCSKCTKRIEEKNIPSNSVELVKPNNKRKIISNVLLADSDSDGENENIASCSKRIEKYNIPYVESRRLTTENINGQKLVELNNKIKIISDVLISKPDALNESSFEIVDIFEDSNNISISSESMQTKNENIEIENKVVVRTANSLESLNSPIEETCTRHLPFTKVCEFIKSHQFKLKEEPIYIDITSDDDSNSASSKAINNLNKSIAISDDEHFECSQYVILDIKQEINDFDCEDIINNKISSNLNDDYDYNKQEKLSSPIYDLVTNDDDEMEEEFDEKLANWYIKLSQGIAVKKELEEEEMIYNENQNELIDKVYDIPQLEYVQTNKFVEAKEKLPQTPDEQKSVQIPHCDHSRNLVIDENKDYKKVNNKALEIIEAPRLPVHKGKLRGVSADSNSKLKSFEKKKLSILKQDKKSNREKNLKEKWLRKPNATKEKEKLKKKHHDRKEKLKIIADKEIQKRKLNESKDTKVLKTPKVKVTTKNRGAFLTEIPSENSSARSPKSAKRKNSEIQDRPKLNKSKETKVLKILKEKLTTENRGAFLSEISTDNSSGRTPKTVTPKRKNSEIGDRPKWNKIPKIGDSSMAQTETKNRAVNEQLNKPTSNSNQNDICTSTVTVNSIKDSTELNKCRENVEKRPGKLTFKSLKLPDDTIQKISTSAKTKHIKSILITKPKFERQRIAKKVRFVEKPLVTHYDHEITTTPKKIQKDVKFNLTLLSERRKLRLRTFSLIDDTDLILSQILSWNPDWLESGSEEVNGPNHTLMPMMHQYQSLSEYENTLFPLLKLEMWVELYRNYNEGNVNNFMQFTLNEFRIDDNKKIIFKCQYFAHKNQSKNIFLTGDFILIQIKSFKIFGYIRDNTFISNTQISYYTVTIESPLNEKLLTILSIIKNINVKKLSSITIELGQFNAVRSLKHSPLLKEILNPIKLIKKNTISIDTIKYEGYHKLNKIQEDIVLRTYSKCINPNEPNIQLIEGPPGTGKSRVVTNLALQILYGKEVRRLDRRILICAPSNAAIDVITLQLIHIRKKMTNEQSRFNLVRFGVVERMHPDVRMYSVRGLIDFNRRTDKINRNGLEAEKIFIEDKIRILKQNNNQNTVDQDELHKLKQNLNHINYLLNADNKNYDSDKLLYPKFLGGAHIICSTLPSCVNLLKYIRFFDVCIIDESTQCSEPWSLIPFQFAINSLVLIGDTQQLPAIVLSKRSKEYNFGKSLFTRISECFENNATNSPIMTLRTQYRMHPEICRWPNSYFYKNRLINDSIVTKYILKLKPYSIFNLQYKQNKTTKSGNISNTLEATFVIELIKHLKELMPFEEYKYGIISPYAQHRDNLQKQLKESKISEIVASTIDSYQGNEKDVVIISNGRTEGVGFLFDVSRLNVSLTRAKKCLILCGCFSNVEQLPAWKSLLNDAKSRNIYYKLTNNDILNFKENVMSKIII